MSKVSSSKGDLPNYEKDIRKLEIDKEQCFQLYDYIKEYTDKCLSSCTYSELLALLPYFEDQDSYPYFHPSAETHRIYIMLNFLQLELRYGKELFISSTPDYESYTRQYILTVFAFRRIELAFCPEEQQDAIEFLTSIPLSVYAAHIIISNEYFENYDKIYWGVYFSMKSIWSTADQIQWLSLFSTKSKDSSIQSELFLLKESLSHE